MTAKSKRVIKLSIKFGLHVAGLCIIGYGVHMLLNQIYYVFGVSMF